MLCPSRLCALRGRSTRSVLRGKPFALSTRCGRPATFPNGRRSSRRSPRTSPACSRAPSFGSHARAEGKLDLGERTKRREAHARAPSPQRSVRRDLLKSAHARGSSRSRYGCTASRSPCSTCTPLSDVKSQAGSGATAAPAGSRRKAASFARNFSRPERVRCAALPALACLEALSIYSRIHGESHDVRRHRLRERCLRNCLPRRSTRSRSRRCDALDARACAARTRRTERMMNGAAVTRRMDSTARRRRTPAAPSASSDRPSPSLRSPSTPPSRTSLDAQPTMRLGPPCHDSTRRAAT